MAADKGSWPTQSFRQSVVAKIEEAIQRSGMPTAKNSIEMENHVFLKAKSKRIEKETEKFLYSHLSDEQKEYLGFVANLILHIREMINHDVKNTHNKIQQPLATVPNSRIQNKSPIRVSDDEIDNFEITSQKVKQPVMIPGTSGSKITKPLKDCANNKESINENLIKDSKRSEKQTDVEGNMTEYESSLLALHSERIAQQMRFEAVRHQKQLQVMEEEILYWRSRRKNEDMTTKFK